MGQLFHHQRNQFAWAIFDINNDDDDLLEQFPSRKGGVSFKFISARGTPKFTPQEMTAYIERYFPEPDYDVINLQVDSSINLIHSFLNIRDYPSYSRQPQLVDEEVFNELFPPNEQRPLIKEEANS